MKEKVPVKFCLVARKTYLRQKSNIVTPIKNHLLYGISEIRETVDDQP